MAIDELIGIMEKTMEFKEELRQPLVSRCKEYFGDKAKLAYMIIRTFGLLPSYWGNKKEYVDIYSDTKSAIADFLRDSNINENNLSQYMSMDIQPFKLIIFRYMFNEDNWKLLEYVSSKEDPRIMYLCGSVSKVMDKNGWCKICNWADKKIIKMLQEEGYEVEVKSTKFRVPMHYTDVGFFGYGNKGNISSLRTEAMNKCKGLRRKAIHTFCSENFDALYRESLESWLLDGGAFHPSNWNRGTRIDASTAPEIIKLCNDVISLITSRYDCKNSSEFQKKLYELLPVDSKKIYADRLHQWIFLDLDEFNKESSAEVEDANSEDSSEKSLEDNLNAFGKEFDDNQDLF